MPAIWLYKMVIQPSLLLQTVRTILQSKLERNELCEHKLLVETAQQAEVGTHLDFAIFQNHEYKGLYGGMDAKGSHERKGLKKSQKISDHMGSTMPEDPPVAEKGVVQLEKEMNQKFIEKVDKNSQII